MSEARRRCRRWNCPAPSPKRGGTREATLQGGVAPWRALTRGLSPGRAAPGRPRVRVPATDLAQGSHVQEGHRPATRRTGGARPSRRHGRLLRLSLRPRRPFFIHGLARPPSVVP